MSERHMEVQHARPAGVAMPRPRAGSPSTSGTGSGSGRSGTPSGSSRSPRRAPAGAGGFMPSEDELLERTLAFSGSFVSDDGNVTVRRLPATSFQYAGDRFVGNCTV